MSLRIDELQRTTGVDIPIEELSLTLRQPKVREISMLGETNYFVALQLFTMTAEQLHIETPGVNGWTILQESLKQKIDGIADTKVLVHNFLQLFFNETVNFGPRSLMIMGGKDGIQNIEPEDFDNLQYLIGVLGGKELLAPAEENFNPKNKRAAEIAEKMKKARKRLAQVKAAENGGIDPNVSKGFLSRYVRTVALGTPNTLEDVNNMTILQLNEMMQMYLAKEAYDLEVSSRLAGAKGDKELVHWSTQDPYHKNDDSIGRI